MLLILVSVWSNYRASHGGDPQRRRVANSDHDNSLDSGILVMLLHVADALRTEEAKLIYSVGRMEYGVHLKLTYVLL